MAAMLSPGRARVISGLVVTALLSAVAGEVDPSGWTPEQCQCNADPAVAALCTKATFYPPDIPEADWEVVGDRYVTVLSDAALTEEQKQTQYASLTSQTGLAEADFNKFATKYAAWSGLPTAQQLRNRNDYCSVSNSVKNVSNNVSNNSVELGFMPCRCYGGGVIELSLSITDPVPIEFLTEEEAAREKVSAVLRSQLSEALGLWFMDVAVAGSENGASGDTTATVHVTTSTIARQQIQQRFDAIETTLGSAGELKSADESAAITLGASTLNQRVLTCAGPVSPPADLPPEATPEVTEELISGSGTRFTCPEGQKFSTGERRKWRGCGVDGQMTAGSEDPLTCVDESATVATSAPEPTGGANVDSSRSTVEGGSTQSTTPFVPDQYEQIDVDWNDGKSIKYVDPNKPNMVLRVTVPAASVMFVLLVLYLLCTRPESCMCNTCGGGKLDEVSSA